MSQISKRGFLAMLGAVSAAPASVVAAPQPSLHVQFFKACLNAGLMTPNEVRRELSRTGGPNWKALPAQVRL